MISKYSGMEIVITIPNPQGITAEMVTVLVKEKRVKLAGYTIKVVANLGHHAVFRTNAHIVISSIILS